MADAAAAAREALADHSAGWRLSPDAIDALARYAALLVQAGEHANLVGTLDPARVAEELILDSLQALPILDDLGGRGTAVDVGSGAGLPGVPLAIARPGWHFTLVEPRRKRTRFLRSLRFLLTMPPVTVVEGRSEQITDRFDLAVSKAVFAPAQWRETASGLLRPGGTVVVYGGGDLATEGWTEGRRVAYRVAGQPRTVTSWQSAP